MSMDNENKNKSWNYGHALLLIAAVPIIYILAIGPVARWYNDLPEPIQKVVKVIYSPLKSIPSSGYLESALGWYVNKWKPRPTYHP